MPMPLRHPFEPAPIVALVVLVGLGLSGSHVVHAQTAAGRAVMTPRCRHP